MFLKRKINCIIFNCFKTKLNKLVRNYGTEILDIDTPIISIAEARRFMSDAMQAIETDKKHADILAAVLSEADYRGHYSHGMNRLEMYIREVQEGQCDGNAKPKILNETPATAWVDGQNGLGAVVATYSMDLAIQKAEKIGVGWVATKRSNHYGIALMYTVQATKKGMIGFCCSNTSPLMTPPRAKNNALGTNPLSVAAPACNTDSFILDMATTAVAVGKIEIQRRKKEPIPEGWALDENGNITTDADVAFKAKQLMPLGGSEMNSGHKGYGLSVMVEVFCGILADSLYGPKIRKWGETSKKEINLGQCFVAINPKFFAPSFEPRLSDLLDTLRCLEPVNPEYPVTVHGDMERKHMKSVDKHGGIRYIKDQHDTCMKLVEELKIKPLKAYQGNSKCR